MKYDKELNELINAHIDPEYAKFHSKIVPESTVRGVRIPILRKIAKKFDRFDDFLNNITLDNYESISVACYYIGLTTKDLTTLSKNLEFILPYIGNWSICDTFVASLKILKKEKAAYKIVLEKLNTPHIYTVRFGIVALLSYFITDANIYEIFEKLIKLQNIDYYIDMAIAWLISIAFIKCRAQTLELLKGSPLTPFVQNKSISKICDSFRVAKEDKVMIKQLRINL